MAIHRRDHRGLMREVDRGRWEADVPSVSDMPEVRDVNIYQEALDGRWHVPAPARALGCQRMWELLRDHRSGPVVHALAGKVLNSFVRTDQHALELALKAKAQAHALGEAHNLNVRDAVRAAMLDQPRPGEYDDDEEPDHIPTPSPPMGGSGEAPQAEVTPDDHLVDVQGFVRLEGGQIQQAEGAVFLSRVLEIQAEIQAKKREGVPHERYISIEIIHDPALTSKDMIDQWLAKQQTKT